MAGGRPDFGAKLEENLIKPIENQHFCSFAAVLPHRAADGLYVGSRNYRAKIIALLNYRGH